jgi:hypothetical protein
MSIYLSTLASVAIDNKYTRLYIKICERALARYTYDHARHKDTNRSRARKLIGYAEVHHILPKSFGLGGETDSHNYVILTAKEHYIVHLLATKMFKGSFHTKMMKGFAYMMCDQNGDRHTSKMFAKLRAGLPGPTKGMQLPGTECEFNGIKFRTIKDAAAHFGVTHSAVQKWIKQGMTEVKPKSARNHGYSVTVDSVTYVSAMQAAKALNIPIRTFSRHLKQGKYASVS